MPDDAVFEDGQVGGAAPDIDQGHPGLLFFLAEHRIGRGQRLQGNVVEVQAGALDAAPNVLDGRYLPHHHVEIGLQPAAVHPDGLLDLGLPVYLVFLRKHVDDFLSREHHQLVHLVDEFLQVVFPDHLFRVGTGNVVAVLEGTDMLTGYADGNRADTQAAAGFGLFHRLLNGLYGLGDVVNHPAVHPQALGAPDAHHLDLPVLVLLPDDGDNLGGADIQSYGIFHFFHA